MTEWDDIAVRLANALESLADEQNGAPLLLREKQWTEAIKEARAALAEFYDAEAKEYPFRRDQ